MAQNNTQSPCNLALYFMGSARALRVNAENWADGADKLRFAVRHCAPEYAAKVEKWLEETRDTISRDAHTSGMSTEHAGKGMSWKRGPLDEWTRDFHARCADMKPHPGLDYFDDIVIQEARAD